jgi:hypothetical protein
VCVSVSVCVAQSEPWPFWKIFVPDFRTFLFDSLEKSLDRRSARSKASTYIRQYNRKTRSNTHASSRIRTQNLSVRAINTHALHEILGSHGEDDGVVLLACDAVWTRM